MDKLRGILDGVRSYWDNLTERERRLVAVLGGIAAVVLVALPVFLLSRSIGQLDASNEELSSTLRLLSRSRAEIAAMRAERTAREVRYAQGAPGQNWLASQVEEHGLSIARVQHEPDRVLEPFTIHTTRASFENVGLRASILLIAELKNSRYPVAIERIHVDHNRAGADGPDAGVPASDDGRAGPPAP